MLEKPSWMRRIASPVDSGGPTVPALPWLWGRGSTDVLLCKKLKAWANQLMPPPHHHHRAAMPAISRPRFTQSLPPPPRFRSFSAAYP
jgi:hypothetical protein